MEKMSFIFLVIIIAYLAYSFIRSRAGEKKKAVEKSSSGQICFKDDEEKEKAALTAAIAAVMGDTAYVIKRVYAIAHVDERTSSWRYAGRNEMMTKKNTLR